MILETAAERTSSLDRRAVLTFVAVSIVVGSASAVWPYFGLVIVAGAITATIIFRPTIWLLLLLVLTPLGQIAADLAPAQRVTSVRDAVPIVLLLAWLARAYISRFRWPTSAIHLPLVLFVGLTLMYVALNPNLIQGLLGARALVFYALLYFLVIRFVTSERHLRWLCYGLATTMVLMAAYSVFAYLVPQSIFPYDSETQGAVGQIWSGWARLHYSSYTYFASLFTPLLLVTASMVPRRRIVRTCLIATAGVNAAIVLVSELRAAWIALVISVAVYVVLHAKRKVAAIAIATLVTSVAGAALGLQGVLDRLITTASASDIGYFGRLNEIGSVWIPLIGQHPFGVGTGIFSSSVALRWQPLAGDFIFQYAPNGVTHNAYFEIAAELGVFGLFVYMWLLFAVLLQIRRNFSILSEPLLRGVNTVLLGQLLGYCAIGLFTPVAILFPVNVYFFVSAGLAVILPRLERTWLTPNSVSRSPTARVRGAQEAGSLKA